jgi:acyl-CoA synthetase (AMP-forming)/AMP-acid ligase II
VRTPLTVADHLARAEHVYPDRIAVVDEPDQPAASLGSLTYRQIGDLARAQAAALDGLGLAVGDRVAVVSHNAARLLVSFFGVAAFGRVLVPVNFRLNAEEIGYIVAHSGARVVLIDPELEEVTAGLDVDHRLVFGRDDDAIFAPRTTPRPWDDRDEDATATINYTSGTTARPKGVQMTHRNLWLNAATFGWHTAVTDRDVYLHTLPMFHANGWGMPFAVTAMGTRQVVIRKIDGHEILRRVESHGVTMLCAAPAVVAAVLDAAQDLDDVPGRGRVRIVVAGAPPPSRTIERVETELGWEFIQLYGLTETAPLLTINRTRAEWDQLSAADRATKLVRAGVPAVGIDVAIDDEGEILVRGNHILAAYWQQPDESAEVLRDGWFHTGDGGRIDEEGYLSIVDRKKDVIISGGENVSSIEVEDVLHAHPAVDEVAVIGVPHERWGETVVALVVRAGDHDEVTDRDLIDHCRKRLAHYKCPTAVEFRDELARTATGKLQKFKLRAPFWEGQDRQVNG